MQSLMIRFLAPSGWIRIGRPVPGVPILACDLCYLDAQLSDVRDHRIHLVEESAILRCAFLAVFLGMLVKSRFLIRGRKGELALRDEKKLPGKRHDERNEPSLDAYL